MSIIPFIYKSLLYDSIEIAVMVGTVFILYLLIYLLYSENTGLFHRVGFDHRIVYLVMIGGIVGSIIPVFSNLPIIVSGNSILAINMGGAVIPVLVSLYFMYHYSKRYYEIIAYIVGTVVLGYVTFEITVFVPTMGVVVGFPMFALPSALGALIALLVYRRDTSKGVPLAYSISTLGVFIGADIVRIPSIMAYGNASEGFMGSIGGAGIGDMVFISGLMAFLMVLPFSPGEMWHSRPIKERDDIDNILKRKTTKAMMLVAMDKSNDGIKEAFDALMLYLSELASMFGIDIQKNDWISDLFTRLGIEPGVRDDFNTLKKNIVKTDRDHLKDLYTVKSMIQYFSLKEKRHLASIEKRMVAYIIDIVVLILIIMVISAALITYLGFTSTSFMAIILWVLAVDTLYFTIMEAIWGQSIGKFVVGIKVMKNTYEDIDFLDALARNVFRKIDELALFYIISVIYMHSELKRRRFGDKLAGTLVVDLNSFRTNRIMAYVPPVYRTQPLQVQQWAWR